MIKLYLLQPGKTARQVELGKDGSFNAIDVAENKLWLQLSPVGDGFASAWFDQLVGNSDFDTSLDKYVPDGKHYGSQLSLLAAKLNACKNAKIEISIIPDDRLVCNAEIATLLLKAKEKKLTTEKLLALVKKFEQSADLGQYTKIQPLASWESAITETANSIILALQVLIEKNNVFSSEDFSALDDSAYTVEKLVLDSEAYEKALEYAIAALLMQEHTHSVAAKFKGSFAERILRRVYKRIAVVA